MDNWIIHEIIKGSKRCKIDYESLANLPDLSLKLRAGDGISITESPDGQNDISVDPEIYEKLDSLLNKVFPVTATILSRSGFGYHELGDVVTPMISWKLARETGEEITEFTAVPQINIGSAWTQPSASPYEGITSFTFPSATSTTSYRVVASGEKFSNLIIGPLTATFTRYRYYGALSTKPTSITEAVVKSLGTSELNDSGTLGSTTLASGKYFLFATPGVKNLVVRHTGTDGIVESEKGTVQVSRKNGTDSGFSYSWVLVPASSVAWSFKITNS